MTEDYTTRVPSQFEDATKLKAVIDIAAELFEESNVILRSLRDDMTVEGAAGVWQDEIGDIVGVARGAEHVSDDNIFAYCDASETPGDSYKGFSNTEDPVDVISDGDMETTGSDVIVDGDMETTGPDVIVDGDCEVTGPDVIVDGDMEAVGVAAWGTSGSAMLSKQNDAHGGSQCLRVEYTAPGAPRATQVILTIGKTYRVHGWYRSDGSAVPRIYETGSPLWTGGTPVIWTEVDFVFVATATRFDIGHTGTATGYVEYDDIVVTDETVACAAWTASGSMLSKQNDAYEGSQCLRIEYASGTPVALQNILTIGKTYRVRGVARSDGVLLPYVFNYATKIWEGSLSTDYQEFDFVFVANHAQFRLRVGNAAGYCEFDAIEVIDETVACADWLDGALGLLSKQEDPYEGSQCLRVTKDGTAVDQAGQISLTNGKTYRVTGRARSDGTAIPAIGGSDYCWTGDTDTEWQTIDVVFVANSSNLFAYARYGDAGNYCEFDALVVIDETEACADWAAHNDALVSKYGDAYEGSQCLRVENGGTANPAAKQECLETYMAYVITGRARSDGNAIPRIISGDIAWTGTVDTDWQEVNIRFKAGSDFLYLHAITDVENEYCEFDVIVTLEDPWSYYVGVDGLPTGEPFDDTDNLDLILAKIASTYSGDSIPELYQWIVSVFEIDCEVYTSAPGEVAIELGEYISHTKRRILLEQAPRAAGVNLTLVSVPEPV